jgi:aromatic ring hydroxylase
MRTGAEYCEGLRDGRKVWIVGVGEVDDVTTNPATRPMVEEYVAWYDRHFDPDWADVILTSNDKKAERRPLAFEIPKTADDLRRLGKAISTVHFSTGGNMTHTPGYGALISLGLLDTVKGMNISAEEVANAAAYRDDLAETGRFLTFAAGGAPIGHRFRSDESDRGALRLVKETDGGVIISGKLSMHTSVPFAEDVFVSGGTKVKSDSEQSSWFIIPLAAPGVRIVCRKPAARYDNPFMAPLSARFDELDAQLWLEDVFIPWERVFTSETGFGPGGVPLGPNTTSPTDPKLRGRGIAHWLFWHQHYGWLAKAEFTLGLALACADAMGLKENRATIEQVVDLIIDVQTSRSCVVAAELDPDVTPGGFLVPGQLHIASASIYTLKARQRMSEILRSLPGSSMVVAPADSDFADPDMALEFEAAFGGGGYTAQQRAALLQLAWDHVSSGLDGRESAFELHANGGVSAWRERMRSWFDDYNQLANGVLSNLTIEMPELDVHAIRDAALAPRRPVTPEPTVPEEGKPKA